PLASGRVSVGFLPLPAHWGPAQGPGGCPARLDHWRVHVCDYDGDLHVDGGADGRQRRNRGDLPAAIEEPDGPERSGSSADAGNGSRTFRHSAGDALYAIRFHHLTKHGGGRIGFQIRQPESVGPRQRPALTYVRGSDWDF